MVMNGFQHIKTFGMLSLVLFVAACASQKTAQTEAEPIIIEEQMPEEPKPVVRRSTNNEVAPGSQRELEAMAGRRVYFGYDRYDLNGQAQQVLRNQAAWLKQYPQKNIIVEGHCDERGTREYNLALGARRANAVRRYLMVLGVDGDRIRTISYGKERPEVAASNETAWARNRRAITLVE